MKNSPYVTWVSLENKARVLGFMHKCAMQVTQPWQNQPHDLGDIQIQIRQVACYQVVGHLQQLKLQRLQCQFSRAQSASSRWSNLNAIEKGLRLEGQVQGTPCALPGHGPRGGEGPGGV